MFQSLNEVRAFKEKCTLRGSQYNSEDGRLFCEESDSNYFQLCELHGLYHNYLILFLYESSHRQNIKEWVWLGANKTLLTKSGGRLYFANTASFNLRDE